MTLSTIASSHPTTTSQVRVGVRVRPLTSQEVSQGGKCVVACQAPMVGIGQRRFTYDAVFDSHVTQSDLYESVSGPLLNSFLDGYNATIMAYGQTGSGKTFTMGSEAHSEGESVGHSGLIQRFMEDIFSELVRKKMDSDAAASDDNNNNQALSLLDYRVSSSFLEVYGEDVHDLLDEERKALPLREDSSKDGSGVIVVGLKSQPVQNSSEALNVLHVGTLNRTTAATLMNLTSSRSHAIFTIHLQQTIRTSSGAGSGDVDVTTTSRFTFVDLAGSERMKKTGAEGERAREGIKINEGLLALGNVINALADEERLAKGEHKKVHVPYRQSKLTRLLQDALGGNSQTLFLACVSPSDTNASETLSTLHYANRARNIKNAPIKNIDATVLELQRLHSLNYVLQCELVKQRFEQTGGNEEEKKEEQTIGQASETLWKRKDVQEYIQLLHQTAEQQRGVALPCSTSSSMAVSTHGSTHNMLPPCSASEMPRGDHGNNALLDASVAKFDGALLDEVNPDEEMAILDELLELQHKDHQFDQEQKKDQEQLKQVEGELEKEESMLLQLRESLKVYHNMKAKYEVLMTEVQNLETEKESLADQLEKATADPAKGCSMAIRKKLEKVETSLARARTETRKHQQMYRKAEQEAQRCKALERKISDLKHGKVALIKKQREAAAKHREYTEAKTREIMALKRKERNTGKQLSKMQTEIQIHKANLEKRKVYANKLSEKLKQTESHLMKLLAMRKRELHEGTKHRRTSSRVPPLDKKRDTAQEDTSFAPKTEEITTMKFLLEKMVSDRVSQSHMKVQYEERVAEYSELMRNMVQEVKRLQEAREKLRNSDNETRVQFQDDVRDHEQNVEDLELKLELVGADLEGLRSKLPSLEEEDEQDMDPTKPSKSEESAMKMLSRLSAPVVRTLLWEIMDNMANTEFDRESLTASLKRKDSALHSFQSEVEVLNSKIAALSNDLAQRRKHSLSGDDPVERIQFLEDEKRTLQNELQKALRERESLQMTLSDLNGQVRKIEREHSVTKEKLTVADMIVRQRGANHEAQAYLGKIQGIWQELGVSAMDRDSARLQIGSCLEDTCERKLQEATSLRAKTIEDIGNLQGNIAAMYAALGDTQVYAEVSNTENMTLLQQLEALQEQERRIRPTFESAVERRSKMTSDVEMLLRTMGQLGDQLSANLATLMQQKRVPPKINHLGCTPAKQFHRTVATPASHAGRERRATMLKNVEGMLSTLEESFDVRADLPGGSPVSGQVVDRESVFGPPNSLQERFLGCCEQDIKALRLRKSEILVKNTQLRDDAKTFAEEMHLSAGDLLSLTSQSIKRRLDEFPEWWSPDSAEEVSRILFVKDGVIAATHTFSQHLELIHESLSGIATGRRSLSKALQGVVERAHKTLLKAVDGEVDASEAYASFHDALFRLPPLSKEHIHACISEMNALVAGVEAMTQSEIEALTVVWEVLNITSSERGQFWSEIEESTTALQAKTESPFDAVLRSCLLDKEEWVLSAVKDATRVYKDLNVRLLKLEEIHREVEKLRSKQDTKSKIISLDSELRILNAKLADFEEKKCNKQRLLTKKTNSSTLLKEERFRKQMQGKFTSKLEQLGRLLRKWNTEEGTSFDSTMLSDEVRLLFENSDHMQTWVENRTAFMHLRTVKSKSSGKRIADGSPVSDDEQSTPRKKVCLPQPPRTRAAESPLRPRPAKALRSTRTVPSTTPNKPQLARTKVSASPARPRPAKTAKPTRTLSTASPNKHHVPRKDTPSRRTTSTIATKKRHPVKKSSSPAKAKIHRKVAHSSGKKTALSPSVQQPKADISSVSKSSLKKRETLLPFGHLLEEATSPRKENEVP